MPDDLPEDPLYTARIPVRWSDMDALGHVNNAVYFTYLEQARIEYFQQQTDGAGAWPGAPASGPVLANAEVDFKRPITYPATVCARLFLVKVGRTSLVVDTVITVEGDDENSNAEGPRVYAEARTVLVWIDRATGRPTPLPDALHALLP